MRDYRAEYQRRVQLAETRGYSRSVARGHARVHEVGAREHVYWMQALDRAAKGQSLNRKQLVAVRTAAARLGQERFVATAYSRTDMSEREAYTLYFSP